MKRIMCLSVLVCLVVLFAAVSVHAQESFVVFCKGVTEKWEPIEPGTEFDSNVISCLFAGGKPFNMMQVVFSIYIEAEKGQALLHRETCDVNPAWDTLYVSDIPLPAVGKYVFALTSPAGDVLSAGEVSITEKKVEQPIAEKNTMDGTTLEGLYNKFKAQEKNN